MRTAADETDVRVADAHDGHRRRGRGRAPRRPTTRPAGSGSVGGLEGGGRVQQLVRRAQPDGQLADQLLAADLVAGRGDPSEQLHERHVVVLLGGDGVHRRWRARPQDSATVDGSFSPVSRRSATSAPTRSSIRAGDTVTRGATRASERPNVADSFLELAQASDGSWIRISHDPLSLRLREHPRTLGGWCPSSAATSACDLPPRSRGAPPA